MTDLGYHISKRYKMSQTIMENIPALEAMKKYPDLKIHIVSHTDRRGTKEYNQKLSEKRAKSTMEYIISKGIDESRLTAEGKGESEPVEKCVKCTEKQHQLNRRSEFLIVKE